MAHWIWRALIIVLLAWIGLELHWIRTEEPQPDEAADTAQADSEDLQASVDALREEVGVMGQKIDALAQAIVERLR